MKIISFYTPNYEGEVDGWIDAIGKSECGYGHWCQRIESRGTWRANCGLKPHFILGCLEQLDEAVLWVDIDGRVRGHLELVPTLIERYDFACWFIPARALRACDRPAGKNDLDGTASGTMFFNNTPAALELLNRWIHRDHGQYDFEQVVLGETWHFDRPGQLRTSRLPQGYCKVFDAKFLAGEEHDVQVEHMQASRRLRKIGR